MGIALTTHYRANIASSTARDMRAATRGHTVAIDRKTAPSPTTSPPSWSAEIPPNNWRQQPVHVPAYTRISVVHQTSAVGRVQTWRGASVSGMSLPHIAAQAHTALNPQARTPHAARVHAPRRRRHTRP